MVGPAALHGLATRGPLAAAQRSCFPGVMARLALLAALGVAGSGAARSEPPGKQPEAGPRGAGIVLYEPRADLQATLLATRSAYRRWVRDQPRARQQVRFSAWQATSWLPADEAERLVQPAAVSGGQQQQRPGQPLWHKRPDLNDGQVVKLGSASERRVIFLSRTVHARQAVELTVGLGAGDRVDAWLNGRKIATAATRLTSGRYGCSTRVDGTRIDQVLLNLDLRPGDNVLLLRILSGTEPSFFFTAEPRPVGRLWERVRRDFPPAENPLLELMHADWLRDAGWFAGGDSRREQELIERLAVECGPDRALIRTRLQRLIQARAGENEAGWLDLCVQASVLATLHGHCLRLRAAVTELGRRFPDAYPAGELLAELDRYRARLSAQVRAALDPANDGTRRLMADMRNMQRDMLVARNPLLRGRQILFVKRATYNSKHYYDDFQHIRRWGGNLCALSIDSGAVREIVPELDAGVFDRYDLSFDGRRIAFGYRRPRPEGFRIWEVGVDGGGLRQVTHPPEDEPERIARYGTTSTGNSFYGAQGFHFWTDDLHPCYLPDGGLCFASTRCEHGVLCTPAHYLACTNLYRLDADGGGLRPLSQGALSEFTPTMLDDGRILYNRWEYVYKGIAAVQSLWMMRPDGSGSEEFYGDNITNPGVFWQARQLPGDPQRAVCIGCGHEPLGVGPVLLVDIAQGKRNPESMISLTPNVRTRNLRGLYQLRNGVWREDIYGPFYADPYPLSDSFFLVSCNPDQRYNDPDAYGLYLLDRFGNRVLIYQDPEISCWQPMPLAPRRRPPVLVAAADADDALPLDQPPAHSPATVFLSDIYRGLEGVERGTVKYLRVLEQVAKPWAAEVDLLRGEDRKADGFGGHLAISHNTHIWVVVLHGVVPVEADGSACFEVPARRNVFFQALDADYMEVQRMRTFVNFEPGERRGCIGCHEHRSEAPAVRFATALQRAPRQLAAQPGETAPRPLYYPSDVQPLWDRHCTECHDGRAGSSDPDLRGELTTMFSRSYENLLQNGWINAIREWNGANYAMQHAEAVPPYHYGAHRSRLVEILKAGHYDVQLSRQEWIKLVTWIDCGAPFYGSYYGRRNLAYRGQPDFRPVPTVASACGVPPELPELPKTEPLPAVLLARWPLEDERCVRLAADVSGQAHDARGANVRWVGQQAQGPALTFTGDGYLAARGLGRHEAISVALWMRPDDLPNRWNPVLFSDGTASGAFHFSLLADGCPNVAVSSGSGPWTHRRGSTPLPLGHWRHLAVTCDPRPNGEIAFYVDGAPASSHWLGLGIGLDLDSFRIGGYRGWEANPEAGFHGALRDIRVYHGVLTPEQVAQLVAAGPARRQP